MARKAEPGISYFRMNTGWTTNKKVRLVFNEFDSHGIWIWTSIVDLAYKQKGYFLDCNDHDALELFATDVCKKPVSLVEEVIAGCVRRGLFNKAVFDSFGILTSVMMQDVYMDATNERRKKGSVLDLHEDFLLIKISDSEKGIHIVPGKSSIPPGRKEEIPGRNTQSREEESKEDKSSSAPATPSPKFSGNGKKEKESEPFWTSMVEAWFSFVELNFKERPVFQGQDPKFLLSIVQKLKIRASQKKVEWNETTSVERFKQFMLMAFQDEWLKDHFILSQLDKQFEKIGRKKAADAPVAGTVDIQYLYDRFREGELDFRLISDEHYEILVKNQMVSSELISHVKNKRVLQLAGTNKGPELRLLTAYHDKKETVETKEDVPYLKKMAVMEIFNHLKSTGSEAVFHAQN